MWISNEKLQEIADRRIKLHHDHESSRPLSEDYEYIGLCGERTFSIEFGYPMDLADRRSGDGGIDFTTRAGTIDVKTAEKPYNLLLENGSHCKADILVLAGYDKEYKTAYLIGWEYTDNVLRAPLKYFGHEILNHYIPREKLRKIRDLKLLDKTS